MKINEKLIDYTLSKIERLKSLSHNTEGIFDIIFFRYYGTKIAIVCKNIGMVPNTVTFISLGIGLIAGHFFYYQNIWLNILGACLWTISMTLDFTDGSLARMTNKFSKFGRILDGVADNIRVITIYFHVCLRLHLQMGWWWIWIIAAIAGYFHSLQNALSDYYRNAYLYFVLDPQKEVDLSISAGGKRGKIDNSSHIHSDYKLLNWREHFIKKVFLLIYICYTALQESVSSTFIQLLQHINEKFKDNIPDWLREKYRELNQPLLWYYKILMMNTRMLVFFICLFMNAIPFFFYFQIIVLNILMVIVLLKQKSTNLKLIKVIENVA
ncbi:CDP-alcohol phosphatidyltransferase family protein [bacterium]